MIIYERNLPFCSALSWSTTWTSRRCRPRRAATRRRTWAGRQSASNSNSRVRSPSYKRTLRMHRIKIRVWKCSYPIKTNKFRILRSRLNNILMNWTSWKRRSCNWRMKTMSSKKRRRAWRPNSWRWRKKTRTCKTNRRSIVRVRWARSSTWTTSSKKKIYRSCSDFPKWSTLSACKYSSSRCLRITPPVRVVPPPRTVIIQCNFPRMAWWTEWTIINSWYPAWCRTCPWAAPWMVACRRCQIKCLRTCSSTRKWRQATLPQWEWIIMQVKAASARSSRTASPTTTTIDHENRIISATYWLKECTAEKHPLNWLGKINICVLCRINSKIY